ncbi:MAG: hypothetical protein EBZ48_13885 [Proteobacteria bacterium]|nr:hypothetical protein [Pseudomonadota bacterium]
MKGSARWHVPTFGKEIHMTKRLLFVLALVTVTSAVAASRIFKASTPPDVLTEVSAGQMGAVHRSSARLESQTSAAPLEQPTLPSGELSGLLLSPPDASTFASETIQDNARQAVEVLKEGARTGNKTLLKEIASLPKNCPGCSEFFLKTREAFSASDLSTDERIYLSSALAASGRADNQEFLYDQVRRAAADPSAAAVPPATLARQLERNQQGGPLAGDVVDQVTNDLSSENPYLRDAAISLLTRQHSLQAAQSLYEYTVNNAARDGFYREGMGLGLMTPDPEAFPYLQDLVRKQDQYSHLALKALLNAGPNGITQAVSLLQEMQSSGPNRALIQGAVDHIPMYGPSLTYMKGLQGSANPTVAELAQEVVREYNSRQAALKKGIEYNDNYASGIIMPTPGPF